MASPRYTTGLWGLTLAPALAAAHFVICYASTGIYCERAAGIEDYSDIRLWLGAITLFVLGLLGLLTWQAWQRWGFLDAHDYMHTDNTEQSRSRFLGHIAFLLNTLSWVGVAFITAPVIIVSTCV